MTDETDELRCCDRLWREMSVNGITLAALQAFYARYKYLIMSRDLHCYHELGALLANVLRAKESENDLRALAAHVRELIVHALQQPATRGGDTNALLHISGYLKKHLGPEEKRALRDTIEKYRLGLAELEEPLMLLRAHFRRFPNTYIEQQLFLFPEADSSFSA